ncbi:folate-binding protein YgfZ [Acidovorax sp. HMWF029]|uniref:CAF17-like 4Fe-4S cluster assembly/insertion protein YgfZ n=1 Tax=Acidovorax sp. HMWF029 TaxID=2056863 RepID=UPI000D37A357|nr:folate-binding protein YgfZ [Acidovorax sp. HMWF029]PTT20920.1 folate-binding protein YgfZ [Acidovorax sp. HMWF029]
MTYPLNGIAPLSHLGVIRVEGEDAAKFLHGQLTQDFALLGMDQARLAAFLSAKGRMQASFIGFKRSATDVLLICSRDLLPPTLKRLSMFVLRAKAKLTDATNDFALYGLAGNAVPSGSQTAWSKADTGNASVVHLYPADGQPRALWVAPAADPAPAGPALDEALWRWSEVKSGVATLTTPVVEAFVPQMLNYESVGGVNFKKGCYPGQEVVARSQFRGTLKRRAYIAHVAADVAVGAEVFSTQDLEQPCGTVVQVAPAPGGGFDTIVSLQISAAQEGSLQVGAADGVALSLQPLPYPLLEDI